MRIHFVLFLIFAPSMLMANCRDGEELLISCTFQNGAKMVTTCLSGDQATYEFGPTGGVPELTLKRHVRNVDMHPWSGFGRWIAEGLTFANGDYRYVLRYAIDKLAEGSVIEGDLWVGKGEFRLAELICDEGSVLTSGYPLPLFDAKMNAGQTWSHEDIEWSK